MLALALAASLFSSVPTDGKPVVSVLYFDNDSRDVDLEAMKKGLTDLIITDLVAWDGVQVVERTRLEDVLKELNFQQTKYVDKATATKLGKVLNAKYLVYGSMLLAGQSRLMLTIRLVGVDGNVVATFKEEDEKDKIFDLEQRVANKLVAQIDSSLTPNAFARRKIKVPDLATVIAYGKALDLRDEGKLEEAQAAFRALVSKSPTFLLGRERQQEMVTQFEEYQKRKKDLITTAVLDAAKLVDQGLTKESAFDSLDEVAKSRFLALRVYKGRFLARVLKQSLSARDSTRVVLPGKEAPALKAMRDWIENQRRYLSEFERASRQHALVIGGKTLPWSTRGEGLDEKEKALFREARLGDVSVSDRGVIELYEFVFNGRVDDGERFSVAPLYSELEPKEAKKVDDDVSARIKAAIAIAADGDGQAAHRAEELLKLRAEVAVLKGDVDGAVTSYQAILDAFPTGNNSWTEGRIKELLEGRGNDLSPFEQWSRGLESCDGQAINVATVHYPGRRMRVTGLAALDEVASTVESKCKPNDKNAWGLRYMYQHLAGEAARSDDCSRAGRYWKRFLELGGEAAEVETHRKAFYAWCDFSEVTKPLAWFRAGDWDFPRRPISIRSYDGKVVTISANTDGGRREGQSEESFDLRLEKQPDGSFKCVNGRWRYRDAKYYEGTCSVTVSKWAPDDAPGFDEGTFTVDFPKFPIGDFFRAEQVRGTFKVKREK